ncbi:PREDICTED: uncharacterized protein LOC109146747 [Ipomoea nil]|uniref:uncharacterized protein LOC109146747 n=1 Tax=Ipomoea nil TaxID=35883 RepID=UPI0009013594|nr:PREDICTED: uncharacterized protein LOC109146747 [Ipomoea nil]
MYVTRPLSHYQKSPESLKVPPEGPNSGFLVLQDVEIKRYTCFGLCKCIYLEDLPFPQNKKLELFNVEDGCYPILLIPVLGQPLSSNRYYAIKPDGYEKGEAFTCSRVSDMVICCFLRWVRDVRPKPLDPHNIYQQFEISPRGGKGSFDVNSVAPDGVPPYFLMAQGWNILDKTSESYRLGKASGLNVSLRKRLPELNFPPSSTSSEAVVVGKWYCPFVFIKDETIKDQMERSVFYEMTLEQRWEQIFTCQNNDRNEGISTILVGTVLDREEVLISGSKAKWDERNIENGVIWFKPFNAETEETSVGLRQEIVEQMKWEQERGGWSGGEKELKVKRREECGQLGGWREFGCYILVERFVLKRMDGSLVMTYSFRHGDKIKSIWV